MKINFKNDSTFQDNCFYHTNRISKTGTIVATSFIAFSSLLTGCSSFSNDTFFKPYEAFVSTDDINDMNIIINDSDCGDAFFSEICEKLEEDGINFQTTKKGENVNVDGSTIITIDQQYNAGTDVMIFAPNDNTRIGYSDSLALSMQTSFEQNGFFVKDISCGVIGYSEDENGNISNYSPTDTEKAIDKDSDTSFVTVSLGTQCSNSEWVAKSIENGLARQKFYLDNYDIGSDLIYKASFADSVDVVADYFGASKYDLKEFNNMKENGFLDSQAVINPNIKDMKVFDKNSIFNIDIGKTRAY